MTREEVLEIIMDPRGGPSPGSPARREFLVYLEGDPPLRALYERQQGVWESLDEWESVEPSLDFDRRLFEKIDPAAGRSPWYLVVFPGFRPSFAVGLAALLIVAGTVLRHQPGSDPRGVEGTGLVAVEDTEYVDGLHAALDDIEMLVEFDALPLGG